MKPIQRPPRHTSTQSGRLWSPSSLAPRRSLLRLRKLFVGAPQEAEPEEQPGPNDSPGRRGQRAESVSIPVYYGPENRRVDTVTATERITVNIGDDVQVLAQKGENMMGLRLPHYLQDGVPIEHLKDGHRPQLPTSRTTLLLSFARRNRSIKTRSKLRRWRSCGSRHLQGGRRSRPC